jgi:hypothetical protein
LGVVSITEWGFPERTLQRARNGVDYSVLPFWAAEVEEMKCLSRLVMVLLVAANAATAVDAEFSRASLKGLQGVQVVVEPLEAEAEQVGLNKTSIQTDVELKLRQAGITVLTEAGTPYLYIDVNTSKSPSGPLYAYFVGVKLCQTVRLDRDPSIKIFAATTWDVAELGTVGRVNLRSIRERIKDLVDMFINAYLSVNPKK